MGSKAKHSQFTGEFVTALCSVNSTGLVFLAKKRLKVCTDITLSVQTSSLGAVHDWTVQGYVVECRAVSDAQAKGQRYQITLLFSDLPAELRVMLAAEKKQAQRSYPAVEGAALFGLN